MRLFKILLLSTALAAFGAGTALAQPATVATTPGDAATADKPKTTKRIVKKKTVKKHATKTKRPVKKKVVAAKAPKKQTAPSTETDAAPGNPSAGKTY